MKLVKSDTNNSDFGWIGRGIEVSGDIFFTEQLRVDGKVVGKLSSESGTLIVGETGQIQAQVDVGVCVIHGTLQGDLNARSRVEIHRSGKLHGDVITPTLLVEEGAIFNGAIRMSQEASGQLIEGMLPGEIDSDGKRKVRGA